MADKLTPEQAEMVEQTQWIVEKEVDWFMRGISYNHEEIRENMRSAGNLALCLAALKWESGGAPLSTFSRYRIRGALYDEINKLKGISRVQWQKYQSMLKVAAKEHLEWNDDRVIDAIGLSDEQAQNVKSAIACGSPVAIEDLRPDQAEDEPANILDDLECLDDFSGMVYSAAVAGTSVSEISRMYGMTGSDVMNLLHGAEKTIRNVGIDASKFAVSKLDGHVFSISDNSGRKLMSAIGIRHLFFIDPADMSEKERAEMRVSRHNAKNSILSKRFVDERRKECGCGSRIPTRECCGYYERNTDAE